MKKIFSILAVALIALTGAKAQDLTDNYARLYAGYNSFAFTTSGAETLNGFQLGGAYAFNVTGHKLPLFVEAGLEYNMFSKSGDNSFHAISLPVNATYKFAVNDDFTITPYAGLIWRFGLSMKSNGVDQFETRKSKETGLTNWEGLHRVVGLFDLGVNFTIMQHYTVGYRYSRSVNSMVHEFETTDLQGNVLAKVTGDPDVSHAITIGYVF